jgi:hypothetical protein
MSYLLHAVLISYACVVKQHVVMLLNEGALYTPSHDLCCNHDNGQTTLVT